MGKKAEDKKYKTIIAGFDSKFKIIVNFESILKEAISLILFKIPNQVKFKDKIYLN